MSGSKQIFEAISQNIGIAAYAAARETAASVKAEMRAAIGNAGFSTRFQNALRVDVYPERARSLLQSGARTTADVAIYMYHKVSYSAVFAYGATIVGSPLLWLPLDLAPRKAAGRKVTAGNFRELIGINLIAMRRRGGRPLLGAYVQLGTLGRARGRGRPLTPSQIKVGRRANVRGALARRRTSYATTLVPLYVGIPSVRLRARFDVQRVIADGAQKLASSFAANLR